jgi:hypothetical protein
MSARFASVAQAGRKTCATSRRHAGFGGYQRSGGGREYQTERIDDDLKTKAIFGFDAPKSGKSGAAFQAFNKIIAQRAGAKK